MTPTPTPMMTAARAIARDREERVLLEWLAQHGPQSFHLLHTKALPALTLRQVDNAVRRLAAVRHISTSFGRPARWCITDAGRARLGLSPFGARVASTRTTTHSTAALPPKATT